MLREFRTQPEWREISCFLVRHFLAIGQRRKLLLERLGKPDWTRGDRVGYNCGRVQLSLRFGRSVLRDAQIEKPGTTHK